MNTSFKTIATIVFCCLCGGISAQNIKIFFPQFIGKEYVFVLNQGTKKDTVQSGVVGETGFVSVNLTLPEKHKNYTGIGSWSVINGNGVNFVVDNEDFSITCQDTVLNPNNTFYAGSRENTLMHRYETEMSVIYEKTDSIFQAANIKENAGSLPPSFLKGMQSANEEYLTIQKELAADTSYAAFFWRTLNYLRGLGNRIYYKPDDQNNYFSDIMHHLTDEIDVQRLYSSGLWSPTIATTFDAVENKVVWAGEMLKMLKRTKSQPVFEVFSSDLIVICEQWGWGDAEQAIINYLESSGRLSADPGNIVNRAILQSKVKIGDKAPILNGEIPTNALLIFYESGCQHCQVQLAEITKHYSEITGKGIRVISISTDENKEIYDYHSKNFPWPDKFCDYQGFKGENIKNYGVIGTPTIYLINEKGIILDRQPKLEDIKALNLN